MLRATMARHAALVAPDLALLTSIGEEHLNLLKTVDRVYQKGISCSYLGIAHVPAAPLKCLHRSVDPASGAE